MCSHKLVRVWYMRSVKLEILITILQVIVIPRYEYDVHMV